MGHCRAVGRCQRVSSRRRGRVAVPADACDVFHGRADSGNQFVDLRAGFPAIRDLVGAWAHLVRPETLQMLALSVQACPCAVQKTCTASTPENRNRVPSRRSDRAARSALRRYTPGRLRRVPSRVISATGLIVPARFDAYPTATTLVLSFSLLFKSSRFSVQSSSRISAWRMTTPFSSNAFQGEKLASWSSVVSRISSPAFNSRPIAREIAKRDGGHVLAEDHLVVLAMKKVRHRRARPARSFRSVRRLVRNAPPVLAFAPIR